MANAGDYTVGWICALSDEYDAAQLMLDSIQETARDELTQDSNEYLCGRIGVHNVVITKLATDTSSSTADATRRMMRTFENIKVVLLVGLGSVAPNKQHEIRLGDVVVGSALAQYTINRTSSDQASCQLHTDLLGSAGEFGEEDIKNTIKSILKKYSLLQCMLNRSDITMHPERIQSNSPTVHHGLVASLNQPTKNNYLPHDFEKNDNILCFTTDPQWVPRSTYCAVIRGIHDYAKTQKAPSDRQDAVIAAISAAAYARNILLHGDTLSSTSLSVPRLINNRKGIYFELDGVLNIRRLKLEKVQKPRRFFRLGRVFSMIWIEPSLDREQKNGPESMKSRAFSELRRFIVIHQSYRASICTPIHTYGGQGINKRDIKIADHARLYEFGNKPPATEDIPLRDPVGIVIEGTGDAKRLHPESLINFGKVYTVEHGASIMNIGYIHKDHMERLRLGWKTPISNATSRETMGTTNKEEGSICGSRQAMEVEDIASSSTSIQGRDDTSFHQSSKQCVSEDSKDNEGNDSYESHRREPAKIQGSDNESSGLIIKKAQENSNNQVGNTAKTQERTVINPPELDTYPPRDDPEKDHEVADFDGTEKSRTDRKSSSWACPFFRLDPTHYLKCGLQGLRRFSDVIQHLKRAHTETGKEYCHRCFSIFEKCTALSEHISKCKRETPREFFYQSEFEDMRANLRLPRSELTDKIEGHTAPDISHCEIKWLYIWQTHFSKDTPGSFFLDDIFAEAAEFLRRQNETALRDIISKGQVDAVAASQTAFKYTPPKRSYWLHHANQANDAFDQKLTTPPIAPITTQSSTALEARIEGRLPAEVKENNGRASEESLSKSKYWNSSGPPAAKGLPGPANLASSAGLMKSKNGTSSGSFGL